MKKKILGLSFLTILSLSYATTVLAEESQGNLEQTVTTAVTSEETVDSSAAEQRAMIHFS
ncbi:hypothetical protein [Enterococcus dongliensis]|uniref:hypothetical protein n=1 Tax=Enterococcus dongliensis TaxID=2559925 RepID=UPI0028919AF1|nr:hypothetical protein [Enterococcus dongliensis]MDT2669946.1 hypothetical protein [Enterococcus dongliensis]